MKARFLVSYFVSHGSNVFCMTVDLYRILTLFDFVFQQRIEDLRAENMRLSQQLENSLSEARRQVESQKEKAQAKVNSCPGFSAITRAF